RSKRDWSSDVCSSDLAEISWPWTVLSSNWAIRRPQATQSLHNGGGGNVKVGRTWRRLDAVLTNGITTAARECVAACREHTDRTHDRHGADRRRGAARGRPH